MKNFLAVLVLCVGLVSASMDADAARRFGGGMSFGRSAPTFSQKAPAPKAVPHQSQQQAGASQSRSNTAKPAQTQQRPSMMRNALMGIAAALGISALLSMLGINGAGMVSLIMGLLLAMIVFMGVRMLLSRKVAQGAGPADNAARESWQETMRTNQQEPVQPETVVPSAAPAKGSVMDEFSAGEPASAGSADVTPQDFDREGFLKNAHLNYVKLQKAWDTGNVVDISDFTTTEIFTAITHQLRERGKVTYDTQILDIKEDLLGIAQEGDSYLAAVHFVGQVKIGEDIENVDEVWTLEKPVNKPGGWLLAGIKQGSASSR